MNQLNINRSSFLVRIALYGLSVAALSAQAAPGIGTALTAEEQTSLTANAPVQVGGRQFRIYSEEKVAPASGAAVASKNAQSSSGAALDPVTTVVNEQGLVGKSRNEVLISNIPTAEAKAKISAYLSQAISVKYYDHMDITALRFATFGEAAQAQAELQALLTGAKVTLPIKFSVRTPR